MPEVKTFYLLALKPGSPTPSVATFSKGAVADRLEDAIAGAMGYDQNNYDTWIWADPLLFEPGHIRAFWRYMTERNGK